MTSSEALVNLHSLKFPCLLNLILLFPEGDDMLLKGSHPITSLHNFTNQQPSKQDEKTWQQRKTWAKRRNTSAGNELKILLQIPVWQCSKS